MSYWQGIVGCGLVGYAVTSMAELIHPPPGMDAVSQAVIYSFGEIFQLRWSKAHMDLRVPFDRRWKNQYTMYSSRDLDAESASPEAGSLLAS